MHPVKNGGITHGAILDLPLEGIRIADAVLAALTVDKDAGLVFPKKDDYLVFG